MEKTEEMNLGERMAVVARLVDEARRERAETRLATRPRELVQTILGEVRSVLQMVEQRPEIAVPSSQARVDANVQRRLHDAEYAFDSDECLDCWEKIEKYHEAYKLCFRVDAFIFPLYSDAALGFSTSYHFLESDEEFLPQVRAELEKHGLCIEEDSALWEQWKVTPAKKVA